MSTARPAGKATDAGTASSEAVRGDGVRSGRGRPDGAPSDGSSTDAGSTEAGSTDAEVTDAEVTDAQVTEAQVSEAQVSEAQVSEASATEATATDVGGTHRAGTEAAAAGREAAEGASTAAGPRSAAPAEAVDAGDTRPAGVVAAPWQALRRFTAARIALGRAGVAVPTAAELEFRLAHARARDAVHLPFDAETVAAALRAAGHETLTLSSAAGDRDVYLQRPDLGRRLDAASRERLAAWRRERGAAPAFDLALVVADGLSALAVHRHAAPLVAALRPHLPDWTLAPVALVHQGRVAIGDEVGAALGAACVVVLIGERPGLSSPDSLGLYITWAPRVGLTDAARNCISNVRPEGLAVEAAAAKLAWLLGEARRRRLTGVALKDEVDEARPRLGADAQENFLVDVPVASAETGTAGASDVTGAVAAGRATGTPDRGDAERPDGADAAAPGPP